MFLGCKSAAIFVLRQIVVVWWNKVVNLEKVNTLLNRGYTLQIFKIN